jgi:hypothetical protein
MTGHLYIGVDPGASKTSGRGGGLAVIDESGAVVDCFLVPVMDYPIGTKIKPEVDARRFYDKLCEVIDRRPSGGALFAVIEEPPPTPIKFDDKKDKGSWRSPFDHGLKAHYGAIKALLRLLCGDNVDPVYPVTWKAAFKVRKDKQTSLDAARELFPEVDLRHKKQHNIAEALLLAEYCRLAELGRRTMAAVKEAQR